MPIRGTGNNDAVLNALKADKSGEIDKLRGAGGFDAAVKLGEQALAALVSTLQHDASTGTVGEASKKTRHDAEEILQAISLLASHLDGVKGPGGATNTNVLSLDNPASIIAHLARGERLEGALTDAQAQKLTTHLETAIKAGENLAQIAEAAKEMDYGNPSRVAPAGLSHVGGNFGSALKETIKDLFEEHQPEAAKRLGVNQMHGGLQAM